MPTALIVADNSEFTRTFVQAMRTSEYFDIVGELPDEESGPRGARAGQRAVRASRFPPDFTRKLLRGERPSMRARGRRLGSDRDERRARRVVAARVASWRART